MGYVFCPGRPRGLKFENDMWRDTPHTSHANTEMRKTTMRPDKDATTGCCYSGHEWVLYRGFNSEK